MRFDCQNPQKLPPLNAQDILGNYKKQRMKTLFTLQIILLTLCCIPMAHGQVNYNILSDWDYQRKKNGPSNYWPEKIHKIIRGMDGQIIAVGETVSEDNRRFEGLFLVIDEKTGKESFRQAYSKSGDAGFYSLVQNYDGSYILVGYQSTAREGKNGWVLKVDQKGNILDERHPKSKEGRDDVLIDVAIDAKGNILAAGYQRHKTKFNALWMVPIGGDGNSSQLINDAALGFVNTIVPAHEGGFVLLGNTEQFKAGQIEDAWVLKVDKNGEQVGPGPKYFGDKGYQDIQDMTPTHDGGYAIAGVTTSEGAGLADMWVFKVDRNFKMQWSKTYGGTKEDAAQSIIALQHGGYAILGQGKGHLASAPTTQMQLLIIDNKGNELDATSTPIVPSMGNERGTSLAETDRGLLVLAGVDEAEDRRQTPTPHIGGYTYRQLGRLTNSAKERERNANYSNALSLSEPRFIDDNDNGYLETKERGYFLIQVKNQTTKPLEQITARIQNDHVRAIKTEFPDIKIGTLLASQSKDVHIPIAALKDLGGTGRLEFTINFEIKGVFASRIIGHVKTNQPDPAKLIVSGSKFLPNSKPQAGQEILLSVEVENRGGRDTGPFDIDFIIPAGVESLESERQSILSIPPNGRKTLRFSFRFDGQFKGDRLSIVMEAQGNTLNPLKKGFHLAVDNKPDAIVTAPDKAPSDSEIFWTSPDPNDYETRVVEVNDRNANIKLMALSGSVLNRSNFATKVNGEFVAEGQKMDEVTLQGPAKDMGRNRYTFKDKIRLQPGRNIIEVVYNDGQGLQFTSRPMTFNYIPKGNPNLYVRSVGIGHDDLKYTVKDAKDIAREFMKLKDDRGRGFRKVDVLQFTEDDQTTLINLKKMIVNLRRSNIKDNDLVVLFISTHGKVLSDRGDYILIPSDFDADYEEQTSLNFQRDVLDELDQIKGKVLVFIDACHSGNAIGSKDFTDEAASKFMNDLIEKTSGMEIIASCSDHEFSWEDDQWQNGAFTEAIIEAFQDKTVQVDGEMIHADIFDEINRRKSGRDGIITIEELRNFLGKRVPHLVRSVKRQKQHPSHKSTELLPKDTPIYMVDQNQ